MIVVADSGPLHYLILLDQTDLLRRLYGEVRIPQVVANELLAGNAPRSVSEWVSAPPSWVAVIAVSDEDIDSVSDALDLGERAAISLAQKIRADLLLIDESAGRAEAAKRSLRVTGTLGVPRTAAEQGLIDVSNVLARLRTTNFYVEEELLRKVFTKWIR
jgi:predicted nucleic acid-binding protein